MGLIQPFNDLTSTAPQAPGVTAQAGKRHVMARGGPFRPENDTSKRCMSFAAPGKSCLIEANDGFGSLFATKCYPSGFEKGLVQGVLGDSLTYGKMDQKFFNLGFPHIFRMAFAVK
jgi:hypothetical protein